MRKANLITMLALIAVGLVGAYATTGYSFPSMTTNCQGCHSGPVLTVTATQASDDGANAAYNVSAPGAAAIAVFDGSAKIAQVDAASGSFSVATGKTYVLQAVAGPAQTSGWGSTTVSPAGSGGGVIPTATPDAGAPETTCGVLPASFRGDASVHLVGTDPAGGWGMGYLYYSVDDHWAHLCRVAANRWSGEVTVTVPAPASGSVAHTIKFWSQDNYGNVGRATTVGFTVAARTAMPMPIAVSSASVYVKRSVVISGKVSKPGIPVVLYVKRPGTSTYVVYRTLAASSAGAWSKSYTLTTRGYYYFKARFAGDSEWLASGSTIKRVLAK